MVSAGLVRSWAALSTAEVCTLLFFAAVHAAMAVWRRLQPASWERWRALPAAVCRVAAAAAPAAWAITRQSLDKPPPYSGRPWDAGVFLLTLVFTSFGATGSVLVSVRWGMPNHLPVCLSVSWAGCCQLLLLP